MPGFTKRQIDQKINSSKTPYLNRSQRSFVKEALKSGNYPGSPGSTKSEIKEALDKIERNPNDSVNPEKVGKIREIFGLKK